MEIEQAVTLALARGHVLRSTPQYSMRLQAHATSCANCDAFLFIFAVSGAAGGGCIAFDCSHKPVAPALKPTNHSTRANEKHTIPYSPASDKRAGCPYCGGNATLQTRCKHCALPPPFVVNSPVYAQRSAGAAGYTPPIALNGFTRTTHELGKPQARYTLASRQEGNYTAPCGTQCTVRHLYLPPYTRAGIDHILAVYECSLCQNYTCIAVLMTAAY